MKIEFEVTTVHELTSFYFPHRHVETWKKFLMQNNLIISHSTAEQAGLTSNTISSPFQHQTTEAILTRNIGATFLFERLGERTVHSKNIKLHCKDDIHFKTISQTAFFDQRLVYVLKQGPSAGTVRNRLTRFTI